jgi:hypothetical protein
MELPDMVLVLIYMTAQLKLQKNTFESELANMIERMTL